MALQGTLDLLGGSSVSKRNAIVEKFINNDMTEYEGRIIKQVFANMKISEDENMESVLLHELIRLSAITLKHFPNELN